MTIRDSLTPRERQIRETLAGMRDDDDDRPQGKPGNLAPVRAEQVARERTAFWFCPRCRKQVQGTGSVCPYCQPEDP